MRILFSQNSIKRHISDVKKPRLRQYLPRSINDRVILPFREGFNFTKLRENKVLAKISEFTVLHEYVDDKANNLTASGEDSDQPGHASRLVSLSYALNRHLCD